MRFIALLALLLILAPKLGAQAASPSSGILGTWETLDLDRHGNGGTLIFAEKESAAAFGGVIVNGRYTRRGNRLYVTRADGSRYDMTATVIGDTLIQVSGDSIVRMIRVPGSSADTGLVGKWSFMHKLPQGTFTGSVRFTAQGGFHLRLPLQIRFGAYAVARNQLILNFPPESRQRGRFSLAGDTLTLQMQGKPRNRFVRAP